VFPAGNFFQCPERLFSQLALTNLSNVSPVLSGLISIKIDHKRSVIALTEDEFASLACFVLFPRDSKQNIFRSVSRTATLKIQWARRGQ
jgi:hypothetical protein